MTRPTQPKKTAAAAKPKRTTAPKRAASPARPPAPARAPSPAPSPSEALPETKREARKARRAAALSPEPGVVAQIRELEAQLDRLIDEASRRDVAALDLDDADGEEEAAFDPEVTAAARDGASFAKTQSSADFDDAARNDGGRRHEVASGAFRDPLPEARPSGPLADARSSGNIPAPPESVFDTARELLTTDFYLRKWGRLAMRGRSEEVDDFGFDPIYEAKLKPALDFLYSTYFRVETSGMEHVPGAGRCLLVANHSGTLPLDGVMIKHALKREQPKPRSLRWLTEDFIYHMPFLGSAMNRLGAVRACQENAERLLAKEQLVAVFPEGVKGIGKLFSERYRLQRFGRGGFIKLCLRTGTPIVPVAVLGAEETNPLLFKLEHLSKALGVPYVPVTPTFPALGPLGLLPAPTKWRIQFGEPLDLSSHGPEAADDEILVGKLAERVRATIQGMLDRAVGARKSVFFG